MECPHYVHQLCVYIHVCQPPYLYTFMASTLFGPPFIYVTDIIPLPPLYMWLLLSLCPLSISDCHHPIFPLPCMTDCHNLLCLLCICDCQHPLCPLLHMWLPLSHLPLYVTDCHNPLCPPQYSWLSHCPFPPLYMWLPFAPLSIFDYYHPLWSLLCITLSEIISSLQSAVTANSQWFT